MPVLLVAAVSLLVYLNSLNGDFAFDDHRAILTNDDLDAEKTTLWQLFVHDFWGGAMTRKESQKSYRPLTVLTFRYLNHYFSGLHPYTYHVVNVALHAVCSLLYLEVCRILLTGRELWATAAACLFAAHAIHTEAVSCPLELIVELLIPLLFIYPPMSSPLYTGCKCSRKGRVAVWSVLLTVISLLC